MPFLGGTIGNFPPGSRRRLLRSLAKTLGPDGHLLLGTDLVKDPHVIEAAYDDSAGVTAQFNLNVLHVLNRELGADFDVDAFEHVAFFDREREWIEMRLRATEPQHVRIEALDLDLDFAGREEIRTEISAKFTPERLRGDLAAAGLELVEMFTDPRGAVRRVAGPAGLRLSRRPSAAPTSCAAQPSKRTRSRGRTRRDHPLDPLVEQRERDGRRLRRADDDPGAVLRDERGHAPRSRSRHAGMRRRPSPPACPARGRGTPAAAACPSSTSCSRSSAQTSRLRSSCSSSSCSYHSDMSGARDRRDAVRAVAPRLGR